VRRRDRASRFVASAGLLAVLALSGCSGGGTKSGPSGTNPLTGTGSRPSGPVVGVKVDDTGGARPQAGLDAADVVYVEPAEGGLTRLLAVYASRRPQTVGPTRSVRGNDPELLAQYGPVALAFSGGAANELRVFERSPLVDASVDAHPDAYRRDPGRPVPYNLFVNLDKVSGQVRDAAGVRDVGFRWSAKDSQIDGAPAANRMSVLSGSTRLTFRWDASGGRWVRETGGRTDVGTDGQPVATRNVLVQFCRVTPDLGDIDQAGNPAPYAHTVGSGRAVLFRDGHEVDGRWTRDKSGDATRYTDTKGKELLLHPGGVWVLLVPTDSPLQVA
jgi:hypothetical protein